MNDENRIDLSVEMYEDLKETLVKAIKNAKAGGAGNAGLDNVQLERIERLTEAAERSQGQVARLLEHLQRHTALPKVKTEQVREFTDKYNALLAQLAGRLEVIDKENRKTHTLIEQIGQAVEAAAMLKNLPVQEHRHTYTLDIKSSKTALVIFVMAVIIVLLIGFIYRISVSNQQLAANDLKYRYIKMKGEATSKRIAELEEIFELNRDNAKIRQMKKDIEEYEQTIQHKVQLEEQAGLKEREAERLNKNASRLKNK